MNRREADEERLAALAADNAAFALSLHRHLAGETGGNVILSPYSVSVALAATYAGARGETRRGMEETLHYALGEDVHPAFADLQAALAAQGATGDDGAGEEADPGDDEADYRGDDEADYRGDDEADPWDDDADPFRLEVANALWGKEGYPFAEEFLALVAEHYGAGLRRADFAGDPGGERERINEWVADRTGGRIGDLLPAGAIDPETVLVLTNAVYFLAAWVHQFDPEDTEDDTFTALDGSESTVPFVHQHLRTNHASVDGAEAVELPYVGGDASMVLVLPEEGTFEEFERDLDADRLFGVFEELRSAEGKVALPRFEFGTAVQLSDALAALGMPDAFEPAAADFDGMVAGEDVDLWVDEVYHETFVSVDEAGTEAAAATAAVMTELAVSGPQWGELRFDRPFLFCIRDRPTNAVLFLGRVVDAGAAQDVG